VCSCSHSLALGGYNRMGASQTACTAVELDPGLSPDGEQQQLLGRTGQGDGRAAARP
jgi:hypothetical protein